MVLLVRLGRVEYLDPPMTQEGCSSHSPPVVPNVPCLTGYDTPPVVSPDRDGPHDGESARPRAVMSEVEEAEGAEETQREQH
jgi:hypothetical protein